MIYIDSELLQLCDHCLGRVYAKLGHGLSNLERGKSLRIHYLMNFKNDENITAITPSVCLLCNNMFEKLDKYAESVCEKSSSFQFSTFLIGSKVDSEILEKESAIQKKYGDLGEPINSELNREIGKIVSKKLNKEVDLKNPDIAVLVDTMYDYIELTHTPLFIYGKYKKLKRGIYQTRTGYDKDSESVEELIGKIAIRFAKATNYKLHGMGREDVDALMLGSGRPFIIELKNPVLRFLNLSDIQNTINMENAGKIEVFGLRFSTRKEVKDLKSLNTIKEYRIIVELEHEIDDDHLQKTLKMIEGKIIYQRTPLRVLHRRTDKVREKRVYGAELGSYKSNIATILIRCDAGLYVKELMHGDESRTTPSLAELLHQKIKIVSLDVLKIESPEEIKYE